MTHFVTVRQCDYLNREGNEKNSLGEGLLTIYKTVFLTFMPQYNSFHSHLIQSNVFLTAMKSKPVGTRLI